MSTLSESESQEFSGSYQLQNSEFIDFMFGVYRAPQRDCEAAFILKDGIVQEVSYKGRTEGERCAFIVENCLKP